jgi:hypothetical protein
MTTLGRWLAAATALAAPLAASAQAVSGTWDVTWAQAVRYERDGSMEIQRWGEALLELHQDGDRVTGSWITNILEEVRWTVEGTVSEGGLTLTSTGHDSDNPELEMVLEMRWRAEVSEDGLEGESRIVVRGREDLVRWRPWSAKRVEGPEGGDD